MSDRDEAASSGGAFQGYNIKLATEPDLELTVVGRGTPGGEYLRRFWHPVGIAGEVGDLPVAVQILGEQLVLFRDRSGRYGLVHRACPHRLASLEYGACEERGIRCCYHGWLFDVDGTVLDAPGQPEEASRRIKKNVRLGAYPVQEVRGLLFAYMGPPQVQSRLPIYDALVIPEMEMVPYKAVFRCNWLQVLDAILDPIHTSFLHSRISRTQYSESLSEIGEMEFYERGIRFLGTNTRRVGEHVWVRVNELIMPNFTQAGALFATDGTAPRYFGRSAFTRWVVPLTDTTTMAIGWANFGERGDPPSRNTPEDIQLIEQGELFGRSYEQRQRFPSDQEAVEGMGPITIHKNEHLGPSDKGIALMRRRLRQEIRKVQKGEAPDLPSDLGADPVATYGGDTVLRVPLGPLGQDAELLRAVGARVMEAQFGGEHLVREERDESIIRRLRELEREMGQNLVVAE